MPYSNMNNRRDGSFNIRNEMFSEVCYKNKYKSTLVYLATLEATRNLSGQGAGGG